MREQASASSGRTYDFLAVHLRRNDMKYWTNRQHAWANTSSVIAQIQSVLLQNKVLKRVFLASDTSEEERNQLRSAIASTKVGSEFARLEFVGGESIVAFTRIAGCARCTDTSLLQCLLHIIMFIQPVLLPLWVFLNFLSWLVQIFYPSTNIYSTYVNALFRRTYVLCIRTYDRVRDAYASGSFRGPNRHFRSGHLLESPGFPWQFLVDIFLGHH